uniref:Uncharacterized protein n=1 Tax=Utricularia reniformis TaxID=192314 RepID=A0A1Y0AYZ5_9LAMI|nr:hypothetical protein AEK19_MT1371 [Utricularia reniformis]ART30375.1 hypothetical protein AEK19_MT1371 [Utricularia reniformis]
MSKFLRASLVHICGTRLPGLQRYYRYSQGTAFLTGKRLALRSYFLTNYIVELLSIGRNICLIKKDPCFR